MQELMQLSFMELLNNKGLSIERGESKMITIFVVALIFKFITKYARSCSNQSDPMLTAACAFLRSLSLLEASRQLVISEFVSKQNHSSNISSKHSKSLNINVSGKILARR